MKKFKFSILAGIATLGLMTGSCADSFLDVSSKTEPNSGNFYKTEGVRSAPTPELAFTSPPPS